MLVDLSFVPTYVNVPKSVLDEITDWFVKKGEDILKNSQALFSEESVSIEARLAYGDAAENVVSLASEEKFDLIVMGNRGETEAEIFSLGSNAEKIVRHADCSVLVVKAKTKISKILAAVDGSESSTKAFRYAVQLAQAFNAQITIMNVVDRGFFRVTPHVAEDIGSRILSQVAEEAKGINVMKKLESGSPAERIIEVAKKENYDLIAVGSRGLSRTRRFLLGSVSDDISHHAHTSILIVR